MIKLYDSDKTHIKDIYAYKDMKRVSELANGDRTLTFFTDKKDKDIVNERYVVYDGDRYTIKEVNPEDDGTEYVGKLDLEDLERDIIPKFTAEDLTPAQMGTALLSGTGWTVSSSLTKQRSVQQFKKTPYQILLKMRDAFMCEISFDNINKVVKLETQVGRDRGAYLRSDLNLVQLGATYDSYDLYTRIVPCGKDGLDITSVNSGKNYLENYQYTNKIKTYLWEDSSYEDAESLRDDAAMKLADMSKPKIKYTCKIIDLAKHSSLYSILDFGIGDYVKVVDPDKDIDDYQKIVKYTEYPDNPDKNTADVANTYLSWDELQDKTKAAMDAWDAISNNDGTVNGVYVHGITNGEGKTEIEVLINGNPKVTGAVSTANSAASAAASATSTANSAATAAAAAASAAASAQTAAGTAQSSADGKNTVYYQESQPTGSHKVGDTWFDTGDGNRVYGWNGSVWSSKQFGGDAIQDLAITNSKIANLDAGKITAGVLSGREINNGDGTFHVTSDGKLTASSVEINGKVIAGNGKIGRFGITSTYLMGSGIDGDNSTICGLGGDQAFWAGGGNSNTAPFHVSYKGKLYATGAEISGNITAITMAAIDLISIRNSSNTNVDAVRRGTVGNFGDTITIGNNSTETYIKGKNGIYTNQHLTLGEDANKNIYCNEVHGKIAWSNVSSKPNLVNGVKGNSESSYRTGNVNITCGNIGALPASGGTITGNIAIGAMSTWNSSGYGVFIQNDGQINVRRSNGGVVRFWRGTDTTNYVNLKHKDGAVTGQINVVLPSGAGTLALASSDVRIKTNVKDNEVDNASDIINKIKLHSFDWTDGRYENPHQKIGFIVDELEEIDPRFRLEGTGGYDSEGEMNVKCVDEFYLLGYVVKAMQEMSARIKELEDKIS